PALHQKQKAAPEGAADLTKSSCLFPWRWTTLSRTRSSRTTRTPAGARSLQQVRQRVHHPQLTVDQPEQVAVGGTRTSPATRPKSAEHLHGADRLIHNEPPSLNVHARRNAHIAGIIRSALARPHATLGPIARITPRHLFLLLFEECVQIGVRCRFQRIAS